MPPTLTQLGRVLSEQTLLTHGSVASTQCLVVLQTLGLVQEVALHLQKPSAVSQVSPVLQVTPVQRSSGTHWPVALQVVPTPVQVPQELPHSSLPQSLAPQLQVLQTLGVAVVSQAWVTEQQAAPHFLSAEQTEASWPAGLGPASRLLTTGPPPPHPKASRVRQTANSRFRVCFMGS